MNYDLNKLLNYPLMRESDMQDLTEIIFNNVLRDDFGNDFEYMKIATDYYSKYYIPVVRDEDAGYTYITEEQLLKFMQNFCLFESYVQMNGLESQYQDKIDTVIKNVSKPTFFRYEDFDFTIESTSYTESVTKLLKARLVSNLYLQLEQKALEFYNPEIKKDLEGNTLKDYERIFKKYSIKQYLKDMNKDLVKNPSISISRKYLNFFLDYPNEFEIFRQDNNLSPEVACHHYIVNPSVFIQKLKKEHLLILETRLNNSAFPAFIKGVIQGCYTKLTKPANKYLVTHMLKEDHWKEFFKIPVLGYSDGIFTYLKKLDEHFGVSEFSLMPAEKIRQEWEVKFPEKPKHPTRKI